MAEQEEEQLAELKEEEEVQQLSTMTNLSTRPDQRPEMMEEE